MGTRRLSVVCKALSLSKHRAEQWFARGLVSPENPTVPGAAREIGKIDAIKLLVLDYLQSAGMLLPKPAEGQPDGFANLTHYMHLHGFKDDKAVLVIHHSVSYLAGPTPRGTKVPKREEGKRVWMSGAEWLHSDVIRLRDIAEFVLSPDHRVSVMILLDEIEERVNAAWLETEQA